MRVAADQCSKLWNPVDGHKVHRVHQEDPHENSQCHWRDHGIFVVETVFNCLVDKADNHFDGILCAAGNATVSALGDAGKKQQEQKAQTN